MLFFKYYLCAINVVVILFMYLPSEIVLMVSNSSTLRKHFDLCVHFLAPQLDLQAEFFCLIPEGWAANTIGLLSSTSAECFPALPSWPISLCME